MIFILPVTHGISQISHYSQFYSSPMTIAPSFAGFTKSSRVSLNWRDQWPAIPGTFMTYSVGVDHFFPRANSGVGLMVYRDVAGNGNLALTEWGTQYSYRLTIGQKRGNINNEWYLRPGIYFKYSQRSLDFEKLTFGDQLKYDGTVTGGSIEPSPLPTKGYLDFSASLMAYTNLYWGGFAVDHLLRPNQSLTGLDSRLPLKLSVFGGAKILLRDRYSRRRNYGKDPENVTFTAHYRIMGTNDQLDIGAYWQRDPLVLGAWFRGIPIVDKNKQKYESIDAIILLVGVKLKRSVKVGFSYDITISNLLSHTGGAFELSLIWEFDKNLDDFRAKHRIIPCPAF